MVVVALYPLPRRKTVEEGDRQAMAKALSPAPPEHGHEGGQGLGEEEGVPEKFVHLNPQVGPPS